MKRNKILTLLTILALMLFGTMNVQAATSITTNPSRPGTTDTGSRYVTNQSTITINGVVSTDHLSAYKILDVYYNSSTNQITYEFTSDFKAFQAQNSTYRNLTVDEYYDLTSGSTSGSTQSPSSTLDALASAYAAYIKSDGGVTGTPMNVSGTRATLTADAGTYLILPTQTMNVYAVMVGNLDFSVEGSAWNLNSATIAAKVSEVGIDKSVTTEGNKEDSYSFNEKYNYIINATVPLYPSNAIRKNYIIHDHLDAGITFDDVSNFVVKDGTSTLTISRTNATEAYVSKGGSDRVAQIRINGQDLTITFYVDQLTSTDLTITYSAHLNDDAVLGAVGNKNSVTLEYSNDPYGTSDYTTEPVDTTVYTYGLEIFKHYLNGGSKVGLGNATFEIYSDSQLQHSVGTIKTVSNGHGTLAGLKEGTYYIKETVAPTGYALLRDSIQIELNEDTATNGTVTGYYLREIANAPTGTLPSTGGMGTILYTAIGIGIMAAAVAIIVIYRKKKMNQQNS